MSWRAGQRELAGPCGRDVPSGTTFTFDGASSTAVLFPDGSAPIEEVQMKGHVALIREQNVEFAVVAVKGSVLSGSKATKNDLVSAYSMEFRVPAVLMAQDVNGVPDYYGRRDLVNFLVNVSIDRLPWREFTIRAA
jgi:hypothetical protein